MVVNKVRLVVVVPALLALALSCLIVSAKREKEALVSGTLSFVFISVPPRG